MRKRTAANAACEKSWKQRNKERVSAVGKARYQRKRLEILRKVKEYKEKNPDKVRESSKNSYLKNREKRLIKLKEYRDENKHVMEKYREENSKKIKAQCAEWRKNNKEKLIQYRKNYIKNNVAKFEKYRKERDAIKKATSTIKITDSLLDEMAAGQAYLCFYCGNKSEKNLQADHVTPLARGGLHILSNIVMACAKCNTTKGKKTLKEFIEYADIIGYKLI